jgi:hypothetical protein
MDQNFQSRSDLRNKQSSDQRGRSLWNHLEERRCFQPEPRHLCFLFFLEQSEVASHGHAQVGQRQIQDEFEKGPMHADQRFMYDFLRKHIRPAFMKIPSRVGISQRSHEDEFLEGAFDRFKYAGNIAIQL